MKREELTGLGIILFMIAGGLGAHFGGIGGAVAVVIGQISMVLIYLDKKDH